jgi:solute carrier family 25 protein 33/36
MSGNSEEKTVSKKLHFAAGGLSGAVATTLTQPLDVLKTRLQSSNQVESIKQSQGSQHFKTFKSLQLTYSREGMRGLFRGLVPNILGITPSRALYFTVYDTVKTRLSPPDTKHASHPVVLTAAVSASMSVYTVMNPVWLVKTRIQLQEIGKIQEGSPNYTGYFNCIRRVYQEEGIQGFYKGLTASYMGIFESGLYFLVYEFFKKNWKKEYAPYDYLLMAAGSKLTASAITYPHEVVRTRMRELVNGKCRYSGVWNAFYTIAREEKMKGLYVGMGTHLLRSVPNAAIMFFVYEFIIDYAKKHDL